MPFTPLQRDWVALTTGKALEFAQAEAKQNLKDEYFEEHIQKELDACREDLREAQAYTLTLAPEAADTFWQSVKMKFGGTVTMDSMTGDRDQEIDTVANMPGAEGLDHGKLLKLMESHGKLVRLQQAMLEAKDGEGRALFNDKDVTTELWTPLVRAEIIPSNAVGDKYSQEAQVFNGAAEVYDGRLKKYSQKLNGREKHVARLGHAMDIINAAGATVGEAVKLVNFDANSVKAADLKELKKNAKAGGLQAQEKLNAIAKAKMESDCVTFAMAVTNCAGAITTARLKSNDGFKIADAVIDGVGKVLLSSVSALTIPASGSVEAGTSTDVTATAGIVSAAFKAGTGGAKLGLRLAEVYEKKDGQEKAAAFASLVSTLGSIIANSMAMADTTAKKDDKGKVIDPGTNGQWKELGEKINIGLQAGANLTQFIAAAVAKDPRKAAAALGLGALSGLTIEQRDITDKTVQVSETQHAEPSMFETKAEREKRDQAGQGDVMGKMNETLAGLQKSLAVAKPPSKEDLEAKYAKLKELEAEQEKAARASAEADLEKQFDEKVIAEIQAQAEAEAAGFRELAGEASVPASDLADPEKAKQALLAMDRILAQAQADQIKWDMIDQISKGGLSMLSSVIPVVGMVAAVRDFIADMMKLYRRCEERNKWLDHLALTFGNASVYGPAIQSRVSSAKVLVSQTTIKVVIDAVKVSGEACKFADATGASTALSSAAALTSAATDLIFKEYKRFEIKRGWEAYRDARDNPGNRKKARAAMRVNSTMSKCVLAYGAVIDGDPIAIEVARRCGLSAAVLADNKDVCARVVDYFETIYSDDPVVMHAVPVKKPWHPGKPELTLESWLAFKTAAATNASPKLDASKGTPMIDNALGRLKTLLAGKAVYKEKRDELFDADPLAKEYRKFLQGCKGAFAMLQEGITAYRPMAVGGRVHADMIKVMNSYGALATASLSQVNYDLTDLDNREEKSKALSEDDILSLIDERP